MKLVLDTSVLISGATLPSGAETAISVISLAELHFGVLVAPDERERARRLRRLAGVERAFDALPVTDEVARRYGAVAASVVAAGRQPRRRSLDLLIAATAAAYDAVLYTRNPKDFAGLDDHVEVVGVRPDAFGEEK